MSQKNNDQINDLEEILDEHDQDEISYIGKTFLYRCVDCGIEKYVKGDELDDVICEECGGSMQIVEEGIYDKPQSISENLSGKTELEELQDKTEGISNLTISDESDGNLIDLSETDEVLESIDLELDLDEEIPEEENFDDEEDSLSSFDQLIPDDSE